jgi:hypothetical protein
MLFVAVTTPPNNVELALILRWQFTCLIAFYVLAHAYCIA